MGQSQKSDSIEDLLIEIDSYISSFRDSTSKVVSKNWSPEEISFVLEPYNSSETPLFIEDYRKLFDKSHFKNQSQHIDSNLVDKLKLRLRIISMEIQLSQKTESGNLVLKQYLSKAPLAFCILKGEQLVLEYANDLYFEIIGKDNSSLGKPLKNILPELEEQGTLLSIRRVFSSGIPLQVEEIEIYLLKNGRRQKAFYSGTYQPLFENGKIAGLTIVFSDVTSIVKARNIIRESEKQFRILVKQSPVAMAILEGDDLVVQMANDRLLDLFWRKTLDEVLGKKLLDIFPELAEQKFPKLLKEVFHSGESYREEGVVAYVDSHDGRKTYNIDVQYSPLLDDSNNPFGIMITAIDVTLRTENLKQIEVAEKRKYRLLSDAMPQFIWM